VFLGTGSPELKKAYPEEIDLYFDNVCGNHLEAAIENMKTFGRIVFCGIISQYDVVTPHSSAGPSNLSLAIPNRLGLRRFIVRDHYDMLNEFHHSTKWVSEGKIK
jgi:NADPH-dependent curcumin reductase CurA